MKVVEGNKEGNNETENEEKDGKTSGQGILSTEILQCTDSVVRRKRISDMCTYVVLPVASMYTGSSFIDTS